MYKTKNLSEVIKVAKKMGINVDYVELPDEVDNEFWIYNDDKKFCSFSMDYMSNSIFAADFGIESVPSIEIIEKNISAKSVSRDAISFRDRPRRRIM